MRTNIGILYADDDDKSLLIVGQQVINAAGGRSDLTAIDGDGNLILIELKRDLADSLSRIENFESQAIRYAAAYASIETSDGLVNSVFAAYVEKHREEFMDEVPAGADFDAHEIAKKKLESFLSANGVHTDDFNAQQKIILAASDFDEQTISAVAWLNKNGIEISCFKVVPYEVNGNKCLDLEKIMPLKSYNDFYVGIPEHGTSTRKITSIKRATLPRIDVLLANKVVNAGDIVYPRDHEDETGILQADGSVKVKDKSGQESILSLQAWLKKVYDWPSVATYVYTMHKSTDGESDKSLSDLREEYMNTKKDEE